MINLSHIRGRTLIIVLTAIVFLVGGLLAGNWMLSRTHDLRAAQMFPQPREMIEFELETGDGQPFNQEDFKGEWNLVFFGFTNCPDICPDTMALLAESMNRMEPMGMREKPRVVFVSVDPERDKGESLKDYVEWFHPDFRAVTGDHEQLGLLTRHLGMVYYREAEDPESGFYNVDHSSSILLIDPEGRLVARFPPPIDRDDLTADLVQLTS